MALVPLRVVLDHALRMITVSPNVKYGTNSGDHGSNRGNGFPVIIQASGARALKTHIATPDGCITELYPHIPIVMHQDHGNSPSTCQSAIDNGFTSVMMDGSLEEDGKTPADFDSTCE